MESFVNIITLNVGMSSSLAGLINLITINDVDIVLLQEVRSSKEHLDNLLGGLGFYTDINEPDYNHCHQIIQLYKIIIFSVFKAYFW